MTFLTVRRPRARAAAVCGLVLTVSGASPAAAEPGFVDRFTGTWTGDGEVFRKEDSSTRKFNCRVENTRDGNTAVTDGECRAMVVFTRDISSEITIAPDGSASGTYVGADTGPATLAGRLEGDTLVLEMTYRETVFTDDKAVMRIENPAGDTYSVSVFDEVDGADDRRRVSHIEFRRRD